MRWRHFFLLQLLLIAVVVAIGYLHQDRLIILKKPPEELAQWYKPDNKRQVWLHTMFNLRREMQAVADYAERGDAALLSDWSQKLEQHYLKIGEMVPQWQKKLDLAALEALQQAVASQQFNQVSEPLDRLQQSCDSCHDDFRVQTALLYRAPDFGDVTLADGQHSSKQMQQLIRQVNAIKIASVDQRPDEALASVNELKLGMEQLGEICLDCHKTDRKTYPSPAIDETLDKLEQSLNGGTLKEQGRQLGTLAVQACARCHGIHRQGFDMREMLTDANDWPILLKHR
ncbi:hypothetical protein DV711_12915 [Motiliproteus coralliicola]|uniref:Uncharacterized protein n=1 Tax=Motiliproteus coralliicola TaxID=2283196 RepID=A0A369WCL0_9GAMM|nr:cytochrome c3 family protein [Motiliproteus coralliicola]RDE19770.1 hypothetical protein DV711_12915 [Motiliproteus coralliicola]